MNQSELLQQQPWAHLLTPSAEEQEKLGYGHTVREILQQPGTWKKTAEILNQLRSAGAASAEGFGTILLTGSGSSQYAGECVHPALQKELRIPAFTYGAGAILATPEEVLPSDTTALLVSLARSGDSPESFAAIELALRVRPHMRHLVITCNQDGRVATAFAAHPSVEVVCLPEETNDRSLVMTSSFTNLVLAASALGRKRTNDHLSQIAWHVFTTHAEAIAKVARTPFSRAVYLGTGCRFAAAREAGLKMLEMTGGRVSTLVETYLGLRHGPMSSIDGETLVVCFLSSSPVRRFYEVDLIRELNRKQLGAGKIIVGESIPEELVGAHDVVVECPGLAEAGDDDAAVTDVVVGQLLALFRCMNDGLLPDSPSVSGVINRVVGTFRIYPAERFSI